MRIDRTSERGVRLVVLARTSQRTLVEPGFYHLLNCMEGSVLMIGFAAKTARRL